MSHVQVVPAAADPAPPDLARQGGRDDPAGGDEHDRVRDRRTRGEQRAQHHEFGRCPPEQAGVEQIAAGGQGQGREAFPHGQDLSGLVEDC